jgi:hypothetical protein
MLEEIIQNIEENLNFKTIETSINDSSDSIGKYKPY